MSDELDGEILEQLDAAERDEVLSLAKQIGAEAAAFVAGAMGEGLELGPAVILAETFVTGRLDNDGDG